MSGADCGGVPADAGELLLLLLLQLLVVPFADGVDDDDCCCPDDDDVVAGGNDGTDEAESVRCFLIGTDDALSGGDVADTPPV